MLPRFLHSLWALARRSTIVSSPRLLHYGLKIMCGIVYSYAAAHNFSPVIGACLTVGAGKFILQFYRLVIDL